MEYLQGAPTASPPASYCCKKSGCWSRCPTCPTCPTRHQACAQRSRLGDGTSLKESRYNWKKTFLQRLHTRSFDPQPNKRRVRNIDEVKTKSIMPQTIPCMLQQSALPITLHASINLHCTVVHHCVEHSSSLHQHLVCARKVTH